ncbi:hypothetical protein HRH25_20710 [Flavisolibacter sp. BT320]|nr:hypothetical protein [Flavisolibacter longurius]
MSLCRLCKQEEATKKNSHILPHFLIKTAINKGGSKQRDYELTFSFSQDEFADLYFGRNITLETIEQYKGRELTGEELEQQNPFAQDYLFCPSCEVYFGLLEDYYSKEVYQKLLAGSFGQIFPTGEVQLATSEKVSTPLVLLHVYSIFFRCSVAGYHGFQMNYFERKLRKVLLHYKEKDTDAILSKLELESNDFTFFPFINTFAAPPADDVTKNFVTILHSEKPFFVYLNNVTFHLYTKRSHVGKTKEFFYGMTDLIDANKCANSLDKPFRVVLFNEAQLNRILSIAYEGMAKRQMKFLKSAFRKVHQRIFFTSPNEDLTNFFIHTLVTQDAPQGDRYGKEFVAKAMYTVLKAYYQIP